MNEKLRLGLIVNSFPTLSETFIINKLMGLLQSGVDVTVFVSSRKNDRALFLGKIPGKDLLRTHHLINSISDPGKLLNAIWILMTHPCLSVRLFRRSSKLYPGSKRAIKAFLLALPLISGKFDIIHFEFSGIAVAYLDALPLLKPTKLLTSCRGTAEQIVPLMDSSRGEQLRKVFQNVDAVHCVSEAVMRKVEIFGLNPKSTFINRPAIDTEIFFRKIPYPKTTSGIFQLVSVGRLQWVKGMDFALIAVKQLVEAGYQIQYDIIGEGPEEERLRFMIRDLGLTGQVNLLGRLPSAQVQEALEKADVFLLPSISEGISNSVLEAMAMELPVVSTIVGGMGEVITDEQEGFLVPPYQPGIMAEKIEILLLKSELRHQMGKAGRKRVEQDFCLRNQIDRFVNEYTKLVE